MMTKKVTLDVMKKRLLDRCPHIKVLDFKGLKNSSIFICTTHSIKFNAIPEQVLGSYGCSKCSNEGFKKSKNARWLNKHLIYLEKYLPNIKFLGPYLGDRKETNYECSKHGKYKAQPRYVASTFSGCCAKCKVKELRKRLINSHEDFLNTLPKRPHIKVISKYKGLRKPIKWYCSIHKVSGIKKAELLQRKHVCNICLEEAKPIYRLQLKPKDQFNTEISNISPTIKILHYAGSQKKCKVLCKVCKHIWYALGTSLSSGHGCPICNNGKPISDIEQSLFNWIKKRFSDALQSDRKVIAPKELDIVIPSKKIAIEVNGLFWHSEDRIGPSYHANKTKAANKAGWRLIHIYEDELEFNKRVVLKTLRHILGLTTEKFQARKLRVWKGTAFKAVAAWFDKNHIQGAPRKPIISYGLFDGKRCVALMSFDRIRSIRGIKSKPTEFELVRFASVGNIAGGASRLFTAFIRDYNPTKIISYSANDWFTGNMYEVLGFSFDGYVKPDYYPIINKRRVHKSSTRRSSLRKLLGNNFNESLSERENCEKFGIPRIYDSGKKRWIYLNTVEVNE
jgi:very-short-patch-repair endonuclease